MALDALRSRSTCLPAPVLARDTYDVLRWARVTLTLGLASWFAPWRAAPPGADLPLAPSTLP